MHCKRWLHRSQRNGLSLMCSPLESPLGQTACFGTPLTNSWQTRSPKSTTASPLAYFHGLDDLLFAYDKSSPHLPARPKVHQKFGSQTRSFRQSQVWQSPTLPLARRSEPILNYEECEICRTFAHIFPLCETVFLLACLVYFA